MPRVPQGTEYLSEDSIRRIFDRMNSIGLKRAELSRMLGYSNGSYITRLEKGELRIPIDRVEQWASALQTSSDYILGKTDDANCFTFMTKKDKDLRKISSLRSNMTEAELKLWIKIGQDILNARKG
jgi:transcriptional regulator with XRE-family HTH domain